MEKPAKMLVIRNITFIVEFEKVKNEGKYQELLTATMSHEMLTPLNSIINLSTFVEQKLSKLSEGKEARRTLRQSDNKGSEIAQSLQFVHIIRSSANILQYLIKDLIDLMNIKLNKFTSVVQPFSPLEACEDVLHCFEVQANEKNLYLRKHIHRESADRLAKVVSDKQRYQQILLNIIQNGVKFTYKGGIDIFLDY